MSFQESFFIVNFTYGDLYKGNSIQFHVHRTERMANLKVKRFTRECERARKRYMGNMHADQSHLDFESLVFRGYGDFFKYCKESNFKIEWDSKSLIPKEDIGISLEIKVLNVFRSLLGKTTPEEFLMEAVKRVLEKGSNLPKHKTKTAVKGRRK